MKYFFLELTTALPNTESHTAPQQVFQSRAQSSNDSPRALQPLSAVASAMEEPSNNNESEVLKCFANYTDNHFIVHADYFKKLELSSGGDDNVLRAIAQGQWGVTDNKNPWLYAFDNEKHVADDIEILLHFPVHLSFDFNNDLFACTAWQMSPGKGERHCFVHAVREFSGYVKLDECASA